MPELPEVEAVRRMLRRSIEGQTIVTADVRPDAIVFEQTPVDTIRAALEGARVDAVGRRGKLFWLELDRDSWLYMHLGMSGWMRNLAQPSDKRLLSHGSAPLDDPMGEPRFLKLMLHSDKGARIAFTDGRRLARIWLGQPADREPRVQKLGPDAFEAPLSIQELSAQLARRKAPIKAVLLDQSLMSGIGNWVADEVLYQARIAPARLANSLQSQEIATLARTIHSVLAFAVELEADETHYPDTWLFGVRWGGKRGAETIGGKTIVREPIGGRTTAWVPEVQR